MIDYYGEIIAGHEREQGYGMALDVNAQNMHEPEASPRYAFPQEELWIQWMHNSCEHFKIRYSL